MKNHIFIAVLAATMLACNSNSSDHIVGTWVSKDPAVSSDTIFIDKIEGERFSLRAHIWAKGKKTAFSREVTFKENTIYLPNDKHLTFTKNKEFVVDGNLYENID